LLGLTPVSVTSTWSSARKAAKPSKFLLLIASQTYCSWAIASASEIAAAFGVAAVFALVVVLVLAGPGAVHAEAASNSAVQKSIRLII